MNNIKCGTVGCDNEINQDPKHLNVISPDFETTILYVCNACHDKYMNAAPQDQIVEIDPEKKSSIRWSGSLSQNK